MPILHVSGVSSQTHCYAVMVILLIRIQETLLSDQSLLDVHGLLIKKFISQSIYEFLTFSGSTKYFSTQHRNKTSSIQS